MRSTALALASLTLLAAAGSASAAVSDRDFLRANRCRGLATGDLAAVDTAAMDAFLKAEKRSRAFHVLDRGRAELEKARSQVKTQNLETKARLTAELTGPCQIYKG